MADEYLVVLFNTRSLLSLVGIILIVAFSWQWDRRWEKEGPESERAGDGGHDVEKDDKPSTDKPGSEYEAMDGDGVEDTENEPTKKKAPTRKFPQTITMSFLGWFVLAISNLLPRKAWIGFEHGHFQIISSCILLFLGFIHSNRIPASIVYHKFTQKKGLWHAIMIGGMFAEGIIMYFSQPHVPVFASPLGGLCVAIAPLLLWRARLVGDIYDTEGRVNPKPVLYNFGGPLLVFGWFWFWIGMNCCFYYPGKWEAYVHIYSGFRMMLSFLSGIVIILTTWFVGYALDEIENLSGQPETARGLLRASAFGMNGYFCGYVYEIKVASIISWSLLGLAAFFPYVWGDYTNWLLLLATALMGLSMAMIHEEGLRMLDITKVDLWTKRAYAALTAIAILIPLQHSSHYFAFVLSFSGALSFAVGMRFLLLDQKRGKKWIEAHEIQEPNVFSYGALLTPLGALILSWAVTMHPN